MDGANSGSMNQWADRAKSAIQFGYDADKEVELWWKEHGPELESQAQGLTL